MYMNIVACNLKKSYSIGRGVAVKALMGTSISLSDGAMCSIMGPSGCGKTTLLNILGCMDVPDSGEVFINDVDVTKLAEGERAVLRNQRLGYVLQEFRLIDTISVYENVRLPMLISKNVRWKDMKSIVNKCLKAVGIEDMSSRITVKLSGGQRQRVAIARALVMNPDIILADEPTGSLDSNAKKEIMDIFLRLNEQGKTIIIVTHDPEIARRCAIKYVMNDGAAYQEQ